MPLVRYEVRCEHSLANPELYRTAGRDDSEGLLEGVAMAGLVGIVRQLGDLAEYVSQFPLTINLFSELGLESVNLVFFPLHFDTYYVVRMVMSYL